MIEKLVEWSARHRGLVIGTVMAIAAWGAWSLPRVPSDAFPDLGATQVILYTRWDRSAELIEDQVTYPIVTAMLGAPKVKTVRGISDFGYSFVYVIFEDGTDPYWARARTQELLSGAQTRLPSGVHAELGPDATGLGWIYQYALVDDRGAHSLAQLRALQDYDLRFRLRALAGVADVDWNKALKLANDLIFNVNQHADWIEFMKAKLPSAGAFGAGFLLGFKRG